MIHVGGGLLLISVFLYVSSEHSSFGNYHGRHKSTQLSRMNHIDVFPIAFPIMSSYYISDFLTVELCIFMLVPPFDQSS